MSRATTPDSGLCATPCGRVCEHEHVRRGRERDVHGDRLRDRRVEPEPAPEGDRRSGEPRQPRRGAHRAAHLLLIAQAREIDDLRPLDVGGRAMQLDRAAQDALDLERPLLTPDLADHIVHVEQRAPAQRAPEIDEGRVAEAVLVERGQVRGLSGEQEGAVEGSGRRAVDLVERALQAELLDRRRHSGGHDPAHPAALDHERDPPPVRAPPGCDPVSRRRRIASTTGCARRSSTIDGVARSGSAANLRSTENRIAREGTQPLAAERAQPLAARTITSAIRCGCCTNSASAVLDLDRARPPESAPRAGGRPPAARSDRSSRRAPSSERRSARASARARAARAAAPAARRRTPGAPSGFAGGVRGRVR